LKEVYQFQIPRTLSEALLLASNQAKEIEEKSVLLIEQQPKVEFYNAVTGSSDTLDMACVAKTLNIKGYGRNKLFQFLRDKNILDVRNRPYQYFCDRGYFRVIETAYSKSDGSMHISLKTVVFQKGMDFIRKTIEKEGKK